MQLKSVTDKKSSLDFEKNKIKLRTP